MFSDGRLLAIDSDAIISKFTLADLRQLAEVIAATIAVAKEGK